MKLRAMIVAVSMTAGFASLMHCGGDDDVSGTPDGGSTSSTSGSIIPVAEGGSTSSSSGGSVGTCVPKTCAELNANCGPQGDGCGGVIESCGTCTQGQETCGGGGVPSRCGGAARCLPQDCAQQRYNCGPAGDGCGAKIDSCGTCNEPQICGGGGSGRCGGGILGLDGGIYYADGGACVPRGPCAAGECGFIANGCGGLIECGGCAADEICGLNTPNVCAKPTCTKLTCGQQGANCGFVADGCGGLLDCGGPSACAALGQFCGGGGPNRCGTGQGDGGTGTTCVNFCLDQQKNETCAPGSRTKLTGTVYAPNGKLPIPDAVVFVPNGSKTSPWGLPTFADGVASGVCEQCTLQSFGTPLIATKTAADGTFTLDNVPPETEFPLVIQLGRWRRVVTIPARTKCTTTALTAEQTRFPKRQNEGSNRDTLPLLAVSTGSVDALECVLYKLGVDKSEFTNPSATPGGPGGRVRLYQDNSTITAKGGARIDINTPRTDQALTNSPASLNQYDAVIFGCPGSANNRDDGTDDRIRAYADRGGRVYATHFNYVYLFDRAPWNATTPWNTTNPQSFPTVEALVDRSFPKGATFADWLGVPLNGATGVGVGALKTVSPPTVQLEEARGDARLFLSSGAQSWLTENVVTPVFGTPVFHYTFNTPLNAPPANQCGRVLFSDFHVTLTAGASTENVIFPAECGGDNPPPLTSQEKVLAFFLFDLTSCITPDVPPPPPTCKKLTCTEQGIECGLAGDGCGGQLNCNPCPAGKLCIGAPGKCVTPACTPMTCESQGAECGTVANGCGQSITCPPCDAGLTCGGSGPNKCGKNDCTPKTCAELDIQCGPAGDGCGGPLNCGDCPPGTTCGGGGIPNRCGAPNCVKRTCQQADANCGPIADGCGGILQCGLCAGGQICGVDAPNKCGKGGPQ